ncbi:MAG: UDP-N-acetylmuramate--L-alanine ligase [bacterium]|nr:UDP-N-acetylmuramate--L-alanine ligase [bacterium]
MSERSAVGLEGLLRVHLVGVGGAGMSALAVLLQQMGKLVSGSDVADSPILERLRAEGIEVFVGHDSAHVAAVDLVARSTAVSKENPEVRAARDGGTPVWCRAELLAAIGAFRSMVAIAGTHGKTTTTAMLAHILAATGVDLSYLVGAALADGSIGARWGGGEWFVVEADESDGTFWQIGAKRALVTSVEADHLSTDRSSEMLQAEFKQFCSQATEALVVCADDPGALAASQGCKRVLYGTAPAADYRWLPLGTQGLTTVGLVQHPCGETVEMVVPMAGHHNALNAVGALAMACTLGAEPTSVAAAMETFAGVARRFEKRGVAARVEFIDDYAHLPTEVSCALSTAHRGNWQRVVCVFQPHRYTRTAHLWQDFASCFNLADVVILTDIYAAFEAEIAGVSGELIWQAVTDHNPAGDITYLASLSDVVERLVEVLRPGDLCLTLGAGDITQVPDQVMSLLES